MRGRDASDGTADRWSRADWWGVVLEAPDPEALGRFYSELLGWEVSKSSPDWVATAPVDGVAYLAIQRAEHFVAPVWPAAEGSQQITMHLDFEVTGLEDAVAHAVELGAREAEFQPQTNVRVMLDPAGHPFCLYHNED